MTIARRAFITGLLAAPIIVRPGLLMAVRPLASYDVRLIAGYDVALDAMRLRLDFKDGNHHRVVSATVKSERDSWLDRMKKVGLVPGQPDVWHSVTAAKLERLLPPGVSVA